MKEAIATWGNGYGYSRDHISGYVHFHQDNPCSPTMVSIELEGIPDGEHGIHIHDGNLDEVICTPPEMCCVGAHFNGGKPLWPNPGGTQHGKHLGDMCFNILSKHGIVQYQYIDPKISLYSGRKYIIGRTIVIHENRDDRGLGGDSESLKTGNAGARIACSPIRKI